MDLAIFQALSVANHYHSYLPGVDIDEFAIVHAKQIFSNSPLLDFQVADGNSISFDPSTFNLICFFDTLYFTGIPERLRPLLDRCLIMLNPGGKLAVF